MTGRPIRAAWVTLVIIPGLLFLAGLALFTSRLSVPEKYILDEVYHAYTAAQYVAGNPDAYVWNTRAPREGVAYTWNHPPAGVLLIANGIALWGDNSYGWRFSSALFGAVGVVVTYLLAFALTRRRAVAVLTSALLLLDGLYFVQSRTGMLDIFGTVFMVGALLFLYRYLMSPADRVRWPLLGTGAFLGLAIATKWSAAYPSAVIGVVALWRLYTLWRATRQEPTDAEARAGLRAHLLWVPVGLVALPLTVYLTAYVPFFLTGHDLSQFIELQKQIYYYHSRLTATHPSQSSWWQWPLALRPVWYYVDYGGDRVANIYANGNLVLSWAFLPAVLWVSSRWWTSNEAALVVLLIGFFGQWLHWAMIPRIAFAYHFLPAVPFGCLAAAVTLADLARRDLAGRILAAGYVTLAVLSFAFFYPIYAAVPLTRRALELRIWFESWR